MSSEPGHTHPDDEPESRGSTAPGQPQLVAELISAVRAFQRATDDVDEAACDALGVNRSDGKCLDVLEEREPMTPGALAEELGLTTGAITTLLDRLEKVGYVTRARDTVDRRRVLVELTPLARRRIEELYGPIGEHGREWFNPLSDDQIRLITDFIRHGTKLNADHAARIRDESSSD
ncbi:MAG: MarR family winged helix-turn-helix transcriptional regulator [Actinomycetota bacterium]